MMRHVRLAETPLVDHTIL